MFRRRPAGRPARAPMVVPSTSAAPACPKEADPLRRRSAQFTAGVLRGNAFLLPSQPRWETRTERGIALLRVSPRGAMHIGPDAQRSSDQPRMSRAGACGGAAIAASPRGGLRVGRRWRWRASGQRRISEQDPSGKRKRARTPGAKSPQVTSGPFPLMSTL